MRYEQQDNGSLIVFFDEDIDYDYIEEFRQEMGYNLWEQRNEPN